MSGAAALGEKRVKAISARAFLSAVGDRVEAFETHREVSRVGERSAVDMPKWTFGYDGAMQLVEAVAEDGSEDLIARERYGYDRAGNRIQVVTGTTSSPEVQNYKVNNLNQLVSERGFGRTLFSGEVDEPAHVTVNGLPAKVMSTEGEAPFRFERWVDLPPGTSQVVIEAKDGNDNTTTETYEVTTTGTTALFEYDLAGNMRYEREPNEDARREYRWDQKNRLTEVKWGTHRSFFEYDGATRRVRIIDHEGLVEVANTTYVWCGRRICQKRAADGETVLRNYYRQGFAVGEDGFFYVRDHLGTVQVVVGEDGETVESGRSYSPWGETRETSGSGEESDFGYTGHLDHEPSGVVLAQYRGYDARLGRWLSRDPIGVLGGINLHGYVKNRPTQWLDPLGLFRSSDPRVHERAEQMKCCGPKCDSIFPMPLDHLLEPGFGPEVEPVRNLRHPETGEKIDGYFDEADPNKIYIDDAILDYPTIAPEVLIHELFHWADYHSDGVMDYPDANGESDYADWVGGVCGYQSCAGGAP